MMLRLCLVAVVTALLARPAAQELRIGVVDLYGVRRVSEAAVRGALAFHEGDPVAFDGDAAPAFVAESEKRLAALPGVASAKVNLVCCEQGRAIAYVGVQEAEAPLPTFRPAPKGYVRLRAEVVADGQALSEAVMAAAQRGNLAEDDSQGHALFQDPLARAVQERFIVRARQDLEELRRVLRTSSDASHRALAAQILGYVPDKQAVVKDLVYAMDDPSDSVRNASMRALMAFTRAKVSGLRPIRVPSAPFVSMLRSPVWTDRNKASLALMELTAARDPRLLAVLRRDALDALVEMARWKVDGHAMPALLVLGRIGGHSDEATADARRRGQQEDVIQAVLAMRQ
jgi:hypothetical protein